MPATTRTRASARLAQHKDPPTTARSATRRSRPAVIIEIDDNVDVQTSPESPSKKQCTDTTTALQIKSASARIGDIASTDEENVPPLKNSNKLFPAMTKEGHLSTEKATINVITPPSEYQESKEPATPSARSKARRSLVMQVERPAAVVSDNSTPNASSSSSDEDNIAEKPIAKKRNAFGRAASDTISIPANVKKVYSVVNRQTGSIGGNGHGGAIYGELTVGSMQKMVNLMKEHTGFDKNSRFIDVGCGLGKPNMHVAQDPGVEFSYGIEMEHVRWMLGMSNLDQVLREARRQDRNGQDISDDSSLIGHRCALRHGDITEAKFFDPFTHVYMFDIGFPPRLFHQLSDMFNRSSSPYLICYHGPRLMIDRYEFDVELITQSSTSMHGSSEGHMGYLYRRVPRRRKGSRQASCPTGGAGLPSDVPCDPLFAGPWREARQSLDHKAKLVSDCVLSNYESSRRHRTRSSRRAMNQ